MRNKLFILLAILIGVLAIPVSASNNVRVLVNGKGCSFDQPPVIMNNRTLVPCRSIFENLGAQVSWNPMNKEVTVKKGTDTIQLKINSNVMKVNQSNIYLDCAPKIINNRTLVPVRAISEALNCNVSWLNNTKTVVINNKATTNSNCPNGNCNINNNCPNGNCNTNDNCPNGNCNTNNNCPNGNCNTNINTNTNTSNNTNNTNTNTNTNINVNTNSASIELEVLNLVNIERQNRGLSPLKWNDALANVARKHSMDMHNRNFFSHTNPDGLSPFDRMKNGGITYRTAAENIAAGQKTAKEVVDSWMNSAGHRQNILNPNLTQLGVGYYNGPNSYKTYWTQCFIG